MLDFNELVNRYIAVWNEPDAKIRRQIISELWTEDALHLTDTMEKQGYDAIEDRVTEAYEKFVQNGGYVFRSMHNADTHHNAGRLNWEMVPANGGAVAGCGIVFMLLDDNGRIRYDYQFNEPLPKTA